MGHEKMTPEGKDNLNSSGKKPTTIVDGDSAPFGSNAVRLPVHQWRIAAAIVLLVVLCAPAAWKRLEPFDPQADYRVPHDLSEDYWTYDRFVETTVRDGRVLVIGDSVIWGEYVTPQQTLSHYLNQMSGRDRFANGGVNGTHPLALAGLVRAYAKEAADVHVILHCNLLWMSSAERDLQIDTESPFNHPRLVPQFMPRIPCYHVPVDQRLGVAIDRSLAFRRWVNHLRVAYFDSQDVHNWSLEHPYENPFRKIRLQGVQPEDEPHSRPVSWSQRGIVKQDIPWIDLDTSLQWRAFRQMVELLESRGNRVFVTVGPFNEHMLTEASLQRYGAMKQEVETWLHDKQVPYHLAALLPSDEYADASHPLDAGYARVARQIYASDAFQRWLAGPTADGVPRQRGPVASGGIRQADEKNLRPPDLGFVPSGSIGALFVCWKRSCAMGLSRAFLSGSGK